MSQDSASSQASGQTQNYGYSSDGTEIDGDGDSQSSVSDDRSTQPIGEPQNPASTYHTLHDHYYYLYLPSHLHGYPEVVEAAAPADGGQAVVEVGDEASVTEEEESVTEEEASVTEDEEEPAQA